MPSQGPVESAGREPQGQGEEAHEHRDEALHGGVVPEGGPPPRHPPPHLVTTAMPMRMPHATTAPSHSVLLNPNPPHTATNNIMIQLPMTWTEKGIHDRIEEVRHSPQL